MRDKPARTRMTAAVMLRDYGPVRAAKPMTDAELERARAEGRLHALHHSEDGSRPQGAVNHLGFVNVVCRFVTAKPLPEGIRTIYDWGLVRDDMDAFKREAGII